MVVSARRRARRRRTASGAGAPRRDRPVPSHRHARFVAPGCRGLLRQGDGGRGAAAREAVHRQVPVPGRAFTGSGRVLPWPQLRRDGQGGALGQARGVRASEWRDAVRRGASCRDTATVSPAAERGIGLSTLLRDLATAEARRLRRARIREQSRAVAAYVATSPEADAFYRDWGCRPRPMAVVGRRERLPGGGGDRGRRLARRPAAGARDAAARGRRRGRRSLRSELPERDLRAPGRRPRAGDRRPGGADRADPGEWLPEAMPRAGATPPRRPRPGSARHPRGSRPNNSSRSAVGSR